MLVTQTTWPPFKRIGFVTHGAFKQPFSSLAPVRPSCSLFLAAFPTFCLFTSPVDRVSPNRGLKACHEADSFEWQPSGLSDEHLGGQAG